MKRFHKNLNIMSIFTAVLLVLALIFWRTIFNIAITNVILNGIIIGTIIFGVGLCFVNIFKLLPEYKWMHAYFEGRADYGYSPRLLRPISLALHNKHLRISTSDFTELLGLVSSRIEEERDSVRYVTNTLIFLGLLGTFWGLIITVGGFAELLMNLDFNSETVLQEMQIGMAGPLSGMATAFTSSLLGLGGSLAVGFLGLQLQFAQGTMFDELTDFMSQYVLHQPGDEKSIELAENTPVDEKTYTKISKIYDSFVDTGYRVCDLIRIENKYPAIIAVGSNEKLFVATVTNDYYVLENTLKRLELCFADTLEGININTKILCVSDEIQSENNKILTFQSAESLHRYLISNKNPALTDKQEHEDFNAYTEYINNVIEYLFKADR